MAFNGFPVRQNIGNLFASYPLTASRVPFCNEAGWLRDDPALTYNNPYLTCGGINIGGGSVDISTAAYTSFSPYFDTIGQNNGGIGYATQVGYYWRINNLVYLFIALITTGTWAAPNPVGQFVIRGLPFTNTNQYLGGGFQFTRWNLTSSTTVVVNPIGISGTVAQNSTCMYLWENTLVQASMVPMMYLTGVNAGLTLIGGGVMILTPGY